MRTLAASVLAVALAVLSGTLSRAPQDDAARIAVLQRTNSRLHARLEQATLGDSVIAAAFAEQGQLIVALSSGLIEQLAADVSRRYLDAVIVELRGVRGKSSGDLGKDTFLGHIKLGEWKVAVQVGDLQGRLRVGEPRLALKRPNLIEIELPVHVAETSGGARLSFAWDSASIADVLCEDFVLQRELRGRVVPQTHVLSGAMKLEHLGEDLIATPVFPERHIRLKLDLTARSWDIAEEALRSQNHSGKCGILMKPARTLAFLHELAGKGVRVRLPDSMFRTVRLPGRLHQTVEVDGHKVRLDIKAESLRVDSTKLWSSASIRVRPGVEP